jgi:hypothetical protein
MVKFIGAPAVPKGFMEKWTTVGTRFISSVCEHVELAYF